MAARKQKRRTYTAEQRERVLADVPKLGVSEAARKHGVPQTSVSVWASARGVQRAGKTERRAGAKSLVAVAASPAVATEKPSASVAAAPRDGRVLRRTRVARLYTPSQKAEVLEYAAAHSVTEASRKFDISRFSIYDWRGKVEKAERERGKRWPGGREC